ncbi:mucin-2-like [Triplophysa dalaica]|uniref:mucin-2-like n=1 Tax=Triplophysa dalaica TaxID=1582913 RepID=UPI0024DF48BE|nr:mucin-2-like [Triplophysa dalaica]
MGTSIAPITQTLPPFTGKVPVSTSSFISSTSSVCCFVNGTDFQSGDIIYNVTDGLGWCFTAYCNVTCHIVKISTSCITPSPSTPFTTTPSSSTTTNKNQTQPITLISTNPTMERSTTTFERSCSSLDPPRQANDTWQSGCEICVCESETLNYHCQPITCPSLPPDSCDEPGEVLVNTTIDCCETYECNCDKSLCPMETFLCPPGFMPSYNVNAESCCPQYNCAPMEVCVYNTTVYQPGSSVPSDDPCSLCYCGRNVDPETQLLLPECVMVDCNTVCPEGHEYQMTPGQCCGVCVSTDCVVSLDNITHTIPVNQTWQSVDDTCVKYTCERVNGQSMTVESKTTCPAFNAEDCVPGTEALDADGCCQTCTLESKCNVQKISTILVSNGCASSEPVEITSCTGLCATSSLYSAEANALVHSCSCCQEMTTSKKEVTLTCADGSNINHSYIYIESCGCKVSNCPSQSMRRRRRRV